MTECDQKKFVGLFETVRNLKTVKCRLTHERVQIDKTSNLPVTKQVPETIFERVGLCPHESRSKRLSCGHTSAHLPMLDAIKMLEDEGIINRELWSDFDKVLNQIYKLDHKKGFAESDLAVLIETEIKKPEEYSENDRQNAENVIKDIEEQHDKCVEKLGKVRDRVFVEMQKLVREF